MAPTPLKRQVVSGWSSPPRVRKESGLYPSGLKKATHTSGSTADSETWSVIGANDATLKRDIIPILHQIEVSLGRPV